VASGWSKMVRTTVATQGWEDLATLVSSSRRYWVRHRCQEAPGKVALIAATRPGGHRR
jgi:hypothetical protein